jgi:hypothetical protein
MRMISLGLVLLAACSNSGHRDVDARTGGSDASGTGLCGGFFGSCSATTYCDFPTHSCGVASAGECLPRPISCGPTSEPRICGCDGKLYANDCEIHVRGLDLDENGRCPVPAGRFTCGYTQCEIATEYCQRELQLQAHDTFRCVRLNCPGTPSCGCLENDACIGCSGDATAGFTVTCLPPA